MEYKMWEEIIYKDVILQRSLSILSSPTNLFSSAHFHDTHYSNEIVSYKNQHYFMRDCANN